MLSSKLKTKLKLEEASDSFSRLQENKKRNNRGDIL